MRPRWDGMALAFNRLHALGVVADLAAHRVLCGQGLGQSLVHGRTFGEAAVGSITCRREQGSCKLLLLRICCRRLCGCGR